MNTKTRDIGLSLFRVYNNNESQYLSSKKICSAKSDSQNIIQKSGKGNVIDIVATDT